jgi:hypothetical protein
MKNPWIQFLYRVCQIGQFVAGLALLLLGAFAGFIFAPQSQETHYAITGAVLMGVLLAIGIWRVNYSTYPSA